MSNEQKLRDAIKRILKAHRITVQAPPKTITDAENQLREIENAVKYAEEALATTEPEPTGMPELPEPDHKADRWPTSHVYTTDQMLTYGEKCWKSGYKHGAWGDNKQTSKQSLQVEPAVNQQLTTEPFDEREAFEKWVTKNGEWQNNALRSCLDPDRYANFDIQGLWEAWQARAAMAQVGDINVVESFTNDTKDALMAGRAYAQEALIRFDDAYDRHPSTEPERNAILADIQLIDAAMAQGVKG